MPDIDLNKTDIPFIAGDGALRVHLAVQNPAEKLPENSGDLISLNFNASGTPFSVGGTNNFKLGVSAETNASLTPYWATSGESLKALADYGLADYFATGNKDQLLLALALGAKADAQAGGTFKYSTLTADASLNAGADASYALVRSFPADTPAADLVRQFFESFRLPSDIDTPLEADEVVIFEYGGYVNFAASVGAGYEISGSKGIDLRRDKPKTGDDVDVAGLAFVEKYGFSLMAKLGLTAGVAGRFRIEVREGTEDGWARVLVRKSRNKSFSIAADVEAGASFESEGLPESSDEFINALVGVNSKNWLNLFNQVKDLTDFNNLQNYVDKLAKSFIEEYTGKAFDALANNAQFQEAIALINRAVEQYKTAGDRAVTLFDKYFDAASGALDAKLTDALDFIKKAESWADIKARINDKAGDSQLSDMLWAAVGQLTDGNQLNWMLGKIENDEGAVVDSLEELKARADKVIALKRKDANEEIQRLISLAKSKFPFSKFVEDLDGLDAAKLKGMTDKRLVGFVERLVGNSIDKLKDSELGAAVAKFHKILTAVDGFKEKVFGKGGLAEQVLNSSYKFKLHAAYKRASEDAALLDVEFDMRTDGGRALMKKAGRGDFLGVIEGYDAGFAKLNEGALTHKATRETSLAVNISGWHLNWNYQSLDRIITETDQHFQTGADGKLNVLTTVDLTKEKEVRRGSERIYTNMLLRFVGESHGVLERNATGNAFLVDTLTGMESSYQLAITDDDTDRQELEQYLSFANEFGITATDNEAFDAVMPYVDESGGTIGKSSVTYNASFTEEGLRSLFTKEFTKDDKDAMRRAARRIVLSNYINRGGPFRDWGWAYASDALYQQWKTEGPQFLNHSAWTVDVPKEPNIDTPKQAVIQKGNGGVQVVYTLYSIEESLIKGMEALSKLISNGDKLDPRKFEDKLADFGKALKLYDSFDKGDNTVFAMFDALIKRSSAGKPYRESSLEVKITKNGKETSKVLVAP